MNLRKRRRIDSVLGEGEGEGVQIFCTFMLIELVLNMIIYIKVKCICR